MSHLKHFRHHFSQFLTKLGRHQDGIVGAQLRGHAKVTQVTFVYPATEADAEVY